MAKNQSYYFSHDINASNDPKIAAMISELGMISYAWWWILIEKLAAADDYKMPLKKYTFVALDNELRMNNEQILTSVKQVFNKKLDAYLKIAKIKTLVEETFTNPAIDLNI